MRVSLYSMLLLSMLAYTLKAEYKSPVDPKDYPQGEITKGTNAIKALPPYGRECMIAETMGLMISPSHDSAYGLNVKNEAGERFHPVYKDAQFINNNGKLCNFYKVLDEIKNKKTIGKSNRQAWVEAKQAMASSTAETLFASFEKDVTKLALATAKYYLKSLSPKLRDAWFALYGDMAYAPNGNDALYTEKSGKRFGTIDFKQMYTEREAQKDALFTDSTGDQYKLNEVWEKLKKQPGVDKKLRLITWCSNLIGVNDILALYPKEVKAMKKYYTQAKKQLKEAPQEAAEESKAQPPAPAAGDEIITQATWAGIPQDSKDKYLTEYFNLYFTPDKAADPYNHLYRRMDAPGRTMGSDNVMLDYNYNASIESWNRGGIGTPGTAFGNRIRAWLKQQGEASILNDNKKNIELLAANNLIYLLGQMPQTLSDAFLADVAGLVYTGNGTKAYPYTRKSYITKMKKEAQYRGFDNPLPQFVDTKGNKRSWKELNFYMDTWEYRWAVCHICAQLMGREQTLALVPEQVEKLRQQYRKATSNEAPAPTAPELDAAEFVEAPGEAEPDATRPESSTIQHPMGSPTSTMTPKPQSSDYAPLGTPASAPTSKE